MKKFVWRKSEEDKILNDEEEVEIVQASQWDSQLDRIEKCQKFEKWSGDKEIISFILSDQIPEL